MKKNEEFFKKTFADFRNSKEIEENWYIDTGIKAYFKNNFSNVEDSIIEDFIKYHTKRMDDLTWSFLTCKKCGYKWAFERQKYKEKNNGNSGFICTECSGIKVVKDGMVNIDDEVILQPYSFIENLSDEEQKEMFIQDIISMNNFDTNEEYICVEFNGEINEENKLHQSGCYSESDAKYVLYFPKIKMVSK